MNCTKFTVSCIIYTVYTYIYCIYIYCKRYKPQSKLQKSIYNVPCLFFYKCFTVYDQNLFCIPQLLSVTFVLPVQVNNFSPIFEFKLKLNNLFINITFVPKFLVCYQLYEVIKPNSYGNKQINRTNLGLGRIKRFFFLYLCRYDWMRSFCVPFISTP